MTRDIRFTAGVVLVAAIVYGIGWWVADRRGRTRLANLRTTLTAQINFAYAAYDTANGIAGELEAIATDARKELAAMTEDRDAYRDAHHRGAEEYERLLERHRRVPVAFRGTLEELDRERDHLIEPLGLFEPWSMPRPDADATEAIRLAAMLGEDTGVWSRVVYRASGARQPTATATWDTGTVHDGELLPAVGQELVLRPTYPAKKQRHGKRGHR